jgi:hypothetical protein
LNDPSAIGFKFLPGDVPPVVIEPIFSVFIFNKDEPNERVEAKWNALHAAMHSKRTNNCEFIAEIRTRFDVFFAFGGDDSTEQVRRTARLKRVVVSE